MLYIHAASVDFQVTQAFIHYKTKDRTRDASRMQVQSTKSPEQAASEYDVDPYKSIRLGGHYSISNINLQSVY